MAKLEDLRKEKLDAVVLDVDGTLLDSNYHHALAWDRAFTRSRIGVPVWRLHRHIGMGGDKLVAAVAGDEVEREHGDALREAYAEEYDRVIDETRLFDGARELLEALKGKGHEVALASSGKPEHAQHAFDLLHADETTDAATTDEDAEDSKPDPQLVDEALKRLGSKNACLVGDSVWDIEAAARAGVPAIGVLAGGFGRDELFDAGAVVVVDDVRELLDRLEEWIS